MRGPFEAPRSLVVVVGAAGRIRRVLRLLEPLLELAVEKTALLGLRLDPLAEALLALGRLRDELFEGVPQALALALSRRGLVGDHRAQLAVEGERGLAAGADHGETLARHARIVPELAQRRGSSPYNAGNGPEICWQPMADLTNEFSWSRSRDATFHDCRRRYFYQYYGAWGGWEPTATDEARRLYVLKQLATRQMWAGRAVHEAIEMALHVFRAEREVPVEPFIADVIERMRGEWRQSRAG